jgi:hypothetical protein
MGWFNRKPRDLIADSTQSWEKQRDLEALEAVVIRNDINPAPDAHLSKSLIAAGGWCAPSEPSYYLHDLIPNTFNLADALDLSTVAIKRGGIKWPIS